MNEATVTIIISVAFGIIALLSTFISYYFSVKEKIEKAASGAIDKAEETGGVGTEKFEIAVEQLKALIPTPVKPFIPDKLIRKIVQETFDNIESYAKKQHKEG
jgi:hypothetical protein